MTTNLSATAPVDMIRGTFAGVYDPAGFFAWIDDGPDVTARAKALLGERAVVTETGVDGWGVRFAGQDGYECLCTLGDDDPEEDEAALERRARAVAKRLSVQYRP